MSRVRQSPRTTTGKFHNCPPEGKQKSTKGFYDPVLNALKNRDESPTSVEDRGLADVIANKAPDAKKMGQKARDQWTQNATDAVADWEATGARIEGRLIAIRTSGPESANCGNPDQVDMHVWIANQAKKSAKPHHSMVVELSPRLPSLKDSTINSYNYRSLLEKDVPIYGDGEVGELIEQLQPQFPGLAKIDEA